YVLMVFRVPALRDAEKDWEPYALDMLAAVLSGNSAARLPRNLVRAERIASSASASYGGLARGPGFFYLAATPTPGKTADEAEQGVGRGEEEALGGGGAEGELGGRKSQAIGSEVLQRESEMGGGRGISGMEVDGISHKTIDLQLRKLREVTSEQVREVARKY